MVEGWNEENREYFLIKILNNSKHPNLECFRIHFTARYFGVFLEYLRAHMVVYFVDYIVVENFASNKNLDDSSN